MAKKIESSKKKRLSALVVDDSRVCRMIHDAYLTRNDFETYTVENGREAVDLIRSGEQFDVIFMDLVMPVMNGFEVSKVVIISVCIYITVVYIKLKYYFYYNNNKSFHYRLLENCEQWE